MKKFLLPLLFLAMFSCNQGNDSGNEVTIDSTDIEKGDSAVVIGDAAYFWEYSYDGSGNPMLRKSRPISADSMNYQSVISLTNASYPDVKLETEKLSNDTLVLKIADSRYLTQRMGSSGPEMYLKELVYNLTELRNIHYVKINFSEGDHARPGTYSRADFVQQ